jgi:hypothetical protein
MPVETPKALKRKAKRLYDSKRHFALRKIGALPLPYGRIKLAPHSRCARRRAIVEHDEDNHVSTA